MNIDKFFWYIFIILMIIYIFSALAVGCLMGFGMLAEYFTNPFVLKYTIISLKIFCITWIFSVLSILMLLIVAVIYGSSIKLIQVIRNKFKKLH